MTLDTKTAATFRATLKEELLEAWRALKAAHPEELFYAFGVHIGSVAEEMTVSANTEEGLGCAVDRYLEQSGSDPVQRRVGLRWSAGDWLIVDQDQVFLKRSRSLREKGPDPYDDTPEADAWFDLVFAAAVQGLTELDREGAFGADLERAALVLVIWGDQSAEERIAFVRALNPPAVAKRFARELQEGYRAFHALSWKRK